MKPNFCAHIKHIYFDLDHTIWDFDANAYQTLVEMYQDFQLKNLGIHDVDAFITHYQRNNHALWRQYHLGEISKETLRAKRFTDTFLEMGVSEADIPLNFDATFVAQGPLKTQLFEGAIKVLATLSQKYPLYIISNGFSTTTHLKLKGSHLYPYFKQIFISEEIGFNKPHPKVFEHILSAANAHPSESVMIGDSLEADIYGAMNAKMNAIYFNPNHEPKPNDVPYQITHLEELLAWF